MKLVPANNFAVHCALSHFALPAARVKVGCHIETGFSCGKPSALDFYFLGKRIVDPAALLTYPEEPKDGAGSTQTLLSGQHRTRPCKKRKDGPPISLVLLSRSKAWAAAT